VNIILLLKELWKKRLLVAGAAAFAALVAALVVYDIGFFPPSLSKQDHHEARGSMEILVDSAVSPIGDVRRQLTPLSERAGIFARYVAGGEVIADIAKETGLPAKQIQVAGPIAMPGAAPGSEEQAPFIRPYGIEIAQHDLLPILDVATRAPTSGEARDLAAAVPAALRRIVSGIQQRQQVPQRKRVTFRALGPAQATVAKEALGAKVALMIFLVLFVLLILLILGLPRFRDAWRAADVNAPEQPHEPVRAVQPLRTRPLVDVDGAHALAAAEEVAERAEPRRDDDG
jgi:hypothetical protein